MKKQITLFAGSLLFVGVANAQLIKSTSPLPIDQSTVGLYTGKMISSSEAPSTEKIPGDELWYNNFSSANHWLSTAVGPGATVGGDFGWQIATAPNTNLTWRFNTVSVNSTSDGGYAVVENGNPGLTPGTQIPNSEWILTYDSTFNFSGVPNLVFQFQEFGASFIEKQAVEVSSDNGATWIEIGNNSDLGQWTAAGGGAWPNPTTRNYIVNSAFAGGIIPTALKFRFRVSWPDGAGNNSGIMYGWFVDDVKFIEGNPNDLKLANAFAFTGVQEIYYSKFPATQAIGGAVETTVTGMTRNMASATQDAVLTVTNGAYTGTDAETIPGFTADSLFPSAAYIIPTTPGVANFTATLSSTNSTLTNTTDDSQTIKFEVTPVIMAVDGYTGVGTSMNGNFTSFGGQAAGDNTGIGAAFEIFEDGVIGAFEVGIASISGAAAQAPYIGQEFFVTFFRYDMTSEEFVMELETDSKSVVANNFGKIVRFVLTNPIEVEQGEVVLAVATSYVGGIVPFGLSGMMPFGNLWGLNGFENVVPVQTEGAGAPLTKAPVVRLDFGNYVGLTELENATEISVAPNPFADESTIHFTLKADAEVSVVVTDLTGREVMTVPATQFAAGDQSITIDGAAFKAGVYNYTLNVGNNVTTKRVVKK